jgi:hypothetical protein
MLICNIGKKNSNFSHKATKLRPKPRPKKNGTTDYPSRPAAATKYLATKLHKGTQRKNICITFTVSVMLFLRRFPGCNQKNLSKKTRNKKIVIQINKKIPAAYEKFLPYSMNFRPYSMKF